jgi:hypothetical protein
MGRVGPRFSGRAWAGHPLDLCMGRYIWIWVDFWPTHLMIRLNGLGRIGLGGLDDSRSRSS